MTQDFYGEKMTEKQEEFELNRKPIKFKMRRIKEELCMACGHEKPFHEHDKGKCHFGWVFDKKKDDFIRGKKGCQCRKFRPAQKSSIPVIQSMADEVKEFIEEPKKPKEFLSRYKPKKRFRGDIDKMPKPKNLLKEIAEKTGADEVRITDEPSGEIIAEYKKPKNQGEDLVKKDMKQLKEDLEFYEHARNYEENQSELNLNEKKHTMHNITGWYFYEKDVKEFIKNIKSPIKAELKFAEKYDTQSARVVKLLLNQILKNINKEAGEEIVEMKVTVPQLIMEMVKGYMKQIREIVTFEDAKIISDIIKKEMEKN